MNDPTFILFSPKEDGGRALADVIGRRVFSLYGTSGLPVRRSPGNWASRAGISSQVITLAGGVASRRGKPERYGQLMDSIIQNPKLNGEPFRLNFTIRKAAK